MAPADLSSADDDALDVYEYAVVSKWTGFFGGWGSEDDIGVVVNELADKGFRLVRSESARFLWFWFVPRVKVLMFFEHQAFEDVDEE